MTRFASTTALPLVALLAARATAWGSLGHETVGYVAQNFVSDETKTWAQGLLANKTDDYLAYVATWADTFKYTSEGAFSSGLHYIDAEDDPPHSCGVDFERDCPEEGCIVSAIANYTERVQDSSLDAEQTGQALKFLVHFLGDIHQPLHDESLEVGGNTINVTFKGEDTNLHSSWDTKMPELLIGGYTLPFAKSWAQNLTASIKTGKYKAQSESWLKGVDIKDAQSSAMVWANDANSHICSEVLVDGVDGIEGDELYPAYYQKSIPIIEMMIAKGKRTDAHWTSTTLTNI